MLEQLLDAAAFEPEFAPNTDVACAIECLREKAERFEDAYLPMDYVVENLFTESEPSEKNSDGFCLADAVDAVWDDIAETNKKRQAEMFGKYDQVAP